MGRGLERFCKINKVVVMLNNMKDFSCLDLKCSVMFSVTSNFHRTCWNLYASLFSWTSQAVKYECHGKHARGEIP